MIIGSTCPYDHEHGPCTRCGVIGPVGWTHECYPCFHEMLREGMFGTDEAVE